MPHSYSELVRIGEWIEFTVKPSIGNGNCRYVIVDYEKITDLFKTRVQNTNIFVSSHSLKLFKMFLFRYLLQLHFRL